MKKILFFITALSLGFMSCTKEKTDYEAEIETVVTEHYEFKEAVSISRQHYTISIEALNGTFYTGYNELRLKITDKRTGEHINASEVTFLPILSRADGSIGSGPHRYNLEYRADSSFYEGYAVFTGETNEKEAWDLHIGFQIGDENHSVKQNIAVREQTNKNLSMTSFIGKDGEQYFIALVSPQKPKIAENELVAGIYRFNKPSASPSATFPDPSQYSYSQVNDYILQLDPRMPEPSMGNHSSPNNKDLTQRSDGLYYGIVNYTMTGNWTLNFIMLNQNGQILKGTEVSTDFTPGIEGAKSDLFIDILF